MIYDLKYNPQPYITTRSYDTKDEIPRMWLYVLFIICLLV